MNQLGTKNMKTVYVLDGDYLRPSFKKQLLYETRGNDTTSFSLQCNDVIQSHEIKVSTQWVQCGGLPARLQNIELHQYGWWFCIK